MNAPHALPDDATLVAWLDGELPADDADRVAAQVAAHPALDDRVRLLRTARAELRWALAEPEHAPPPAPFATRQRARPGWRWLLAAAALTIVVLVARWRPDDRVEAAENDWLAVELGSRRPGWELFSDVTFRLTARARTATPCRIIAPQEGESDAQLGARALAENDGKPIVPLLLEAEVTGPDGVVSGRAPRLEATFTEQPGDVALRLIDLRVHYRGIAPLLTVRLGQDRAEQDFRWGFANGVTPESGRAIGYVPQEPGPARLTVRLRALPTAPGQSPAFDQPLEVAIGYVVRGAVGAWSAPVDGMRARIVAGTERPRDGAPLVFAVQLRNDSDRAREYNVTGSTLAAIPQPFHFDLMVDGEAWRQRDDLAVVTAARWLALPQPVGSLRSVVALTDYWEHGARKASQLQGAHRIAARFHFEPAIWQATNKALWRGRIETPPITVRFGDR